jgi:flavin reductase (DIM6/NTAB) family NADH-FMN oxidoreductase RutF
MTALEFRTIEPKRLYCGTPVALISSLNEDGATNLAPRSSFWAPGWTLVPGALDRTKTAENLARHPECVVNIASPELCDNVEELASLPGKNPVPETKAKPFRFEPDKFKSAGLTPLESNLVRPARACECPVRTEARAQNLHRISGANSSSWAVGLRPRLKFVRLHVATDFVLGDRYIDAVKWSPLIYNFRHYFRLAEHELGKTFRAQR